MRLSVITLVVLVAFSGCVASQDKPSPPEVWGFSKLVYDLEDGSSIVVRVDGQEQVMDADMASVEAVRVLFKKTGMLDDYLVLASSDMRVIRTEISPCYQGCERPLTRVDWNNRGAPLPHGIGLRVEDLADPYHVALNLTDVMLADGAYYPVSFRQNGVQARLSSVEHSDAIRLDAFPLRAFEGAPAGGWDYEFFAGEDRDVPGFGYTPMEVIDWFFENEPGEKRKVESGGCLGAVIGRPLGERRNLTTIPQRPMDILPLFSNQPVSSFSVDVTDSAGKAAYWGFGRDYPDTLSEEPEYDKPVMWGTYESKCAKKAPMLPIEEAFKLEERFKEMHETPFTSYRSRHNPWLRGEPVVAFEFTYWADQFACEPDSSCGGVADTLSFRSDNLHLIFFQFDASKRPLLDRL